jgi:septum formation protein
MAARKQSIVLASASPVRRQLLESAGLEFDVEVSNVDEVIVRQALAEEAADIEPGDLAEVLARAKAEDVARAVDADIVIGADQVLAMDGAIYAKAETIPQARRQLLEFKGKVHQFHSAVAIVKDGSFHWVHVEEVSVHMRDYSSAFVGRYLAAAEEDALKSVGCYQIEGLGVQLIDKVEGDYFTVLGLPLLPLLGELRKLGVIGT